jgi:hypothetical protein
MTEQELREYNRKEKERRVDEGYTYAQEAVEWGNDPNNMTDLGLKLHNLFNKSNQPNAHENIDSLIVRDENKDYFELMDALAPLKSINSLMPWQTYPRAGAQMQQGVQESGGFGQTLPAALRGLLEQFTGGYDPIGYQQIRDRKVKSIAEKHVNDLFQK